MHTQHTQKTAGSTEKNGTVTAPAMSGIQAGARLLTRAGQLYRRLRADEHRTSFLGGLLCGLMGVFALQVASESSALSRLLYVQGQFGAVQVLLELAFIASLTLLLSRLETLLNIWVIEEDSIASVEAGATRTAPARAVAIDIALLVATSLFAYAGSFDAHQIVLLVIIAGAAEFLLLEWQIIARHWRINDMPLVTVERTHPVLPHFSRSLQTIVITALLPLFLWQTGMQVTLANPNAERARLTEQELLMGGPGGASGALLSAMDQAASTGALADGLLHESAPAGDASSGVLLFGSGSVSSEGNAPEEEPAATLLGIGSDGSTPGLSLRFSLPAHRLYADAEDLRDRLRVKITGDDGAEFLAAPKIARTDDGYLLTLSVTSPLPAGRYGVRLDLLPGRGMLQRLEHALGAQKEIALFDGALPLGDIAWNTDRDRYMTGETAVVSLSLLDASGKPSCGEAVSVTVTDPLGRASSAFDHPGKAAAACPADTRVKPDYTFSLSLPESGAYRLLAVTGSGASTRAWEYVVKAENEQPLVRFARLGPSRIVAGAAASLTLAVTPSRTFIGTVTETIPFSGDVRAEGVALVERMGDGWSVTWERQWDAGETYLLHYTLTVPASLTGFLPLQPAKAAGVLAEDVPVQQSSSAASEISSAGASSEGASSSASSEQSSSSEESAPASASSSSLSLSSSADASSSAHAESSASSASSEGTSSSGEAASSAFSQSQAAASASSDAAFSASSSSKSSEMEASSSSTSAASSASSAPETFSLRRALPFLAALIGAEEAEIIPETDVDIASKAKSAETNASAAASDAADTGFEEASSVSSDESSEASSIASSEISAEPVPAASEDAPALQVLPRVFAVTETRSWQLMSAEAVVVAPVEVSDEPSALELTPSKELFEAKEEPTFRLLAIDLADIPAAADDTLAASDALSALAKATVSDADITEEIVQSIIAMRTADIAEQVLRDSVASNAIRDALGEEAGSARRTDRLQEAVTDAVLEKGTLESLAAIASRNQAVMEAVAQAITPAAKQTILDAALDGSVDGSVDAAAVAQAVQEQMGGSLTDVTRTVTDALLQDPHTNQTVVDAASAQSILPAQDAASAPVLSVRLRDRNGKVTEPKYRFKKGSVLLVLEPERRFTPGLYTLEVTFHNPLTGEEQTLTQDFAWGVLAMNARQDRYDQGDLVHMAFGVLDDLGEMVCDATLRLTVTSPSGETVVLSTDDQSIAVTDTCLTKQAGFIEPDYEAFFTVVEHGTYDLSLEATTISGTRSLTSSLEVGEPAPFTVSRRAATRLWPFAPSPMNIAITFHQAYAGTVEDIVPDGFAITDAGGASVRKNEAGETILSWSGYWSVGEEAVFSYRYDAPDISPEFYLIGPLQMGNDTENRAWQIANDAATVRTWTGQGGDGNWSTATNWSGNSVPAANEIAYFDGTGKSDSTVDASFQGMVAGLKLGSTYTGTVLLARNLAVSGSLVLSGGTLDASASNYTITVKNNWQDFGGHLNARQSTVIIASSGSTVLTATGSFYNLTLDNGLIGLWKLDEGKGGSGAKVTDSSRFRRDGRIYGNPAWTGSLIASSTGPTAPTLFNNPQALRLDGTDDHIAIENLIVPQKEGTVSLWWKPRETLATANHPLFNVGVGSPLRLFNVDADLGNLYGGWYNNGNDDRVSWSTATVALNVWHHINVKWVNGGVTELVFDGESRGTTPSLDATWDTAGITAYIGRDATASPNTFPFADVDDIRVYNRALSFSEMADLTDGLPAAGSGKVILGAALSVSGTLLLNGSVLDASASNYNLRLGGNFHNAGGRLNARSNTTTLTATTGHILSGSTVFNNFTWRPSSNYTLLLDYAGRQSVSGALVLQETSGGRALIRSTRSGSGARLQLDGDAGTQTINNLNVKDNNASGGATIVCLTAESCVDSGNNTNWTFGLRLTGTAYSDEGSTALASKTVAVSLNGAAAAATTTTSSTGAFAFNSLNLTGGTIITLYLDGETEDAVTVLRGTGSNVMTGINLYQNRLIVRSGSGVTLGNGTALTSRDLNVANNNGDTDIDAIYTMSSDNLTLVSGKTLYVWTGSTLDVGGTVNADYLHLNGSLRQNSNAVTVNTLYTQSGGTFIGSNSGSALTFGFYNQDNGTFISTSGILDVGDAATTTATIFHQSGGTFLHNSGTLLLQETSVLDLCDETLTMNVPSSITLNNFIINISENTSCQSGGNPASIFHISSEDTVTVLGDYTQREGRLETGTIDLKGNAYVHGGSDGGIGTLKFTGNRTQTIKGSGAIARLPFIEIDTSGSVEPAAGSTAFGIGALTLTAGTFTAPSGTLQISPQVDNSNTIFQQESGTTFTHNNGTLLFDIAEGLYTNLCDEDVQTIDVPGSITLWNVTFNLRQNTGCGGNEDARIQISAGDRLLISGKFVHYNGILNSGAIEARGDITVFTNADGGTTELKMTGTGTQMLNVYSGGVPLEGTWRVAKTAGSVTLSGAALALDTTGQDLIMTGGTLDLKGYNLTVDDQFVLGSGATLRLHGGQTLTGGPDVAYRHSTMHYTDPSGSTAIQNMVYGNLVLGSTGTTTFTLPASTMDVNGNLTISGGTLRVTNANNILLSGSWLKTSAANAGFTAGTGTITLDGNSQTLSGSTTFYNLTKTVTSPKTLTFAATTTQTISNTLTLQGAANNRLLLRSSQTGTQWKIDPQATRTVTYLDVKDSNNTNATAIDCSTTCLDSGNNTNWTLPYSIRGNVYSDEGSTPLASKTVAVSLNGAAAVATAETDSNGEFVLNELTVTGGTIITLYLDNETEDAVTVLRGSSTFLTGVDLYQNRLIVRSGSGVTLGNGTAISSRDLNVANNNGDTDIDAIYTMSSDNITLADTKRLYVWTGSTLNLGGTIDTDYLHLNGSLTQGNNAITVNDIYTQSGGTFTGSSGGSAITVGLFNQENGTFVSTSGEFKVEKTYAIDFNATVDAFIHQGGVFTHNSGTGTLSITDSGGSGCNGFVNVTLAESVRFHNLKISGGDDCNSDRIAYKTPGSGHIVVENTLTHQNEVINGRIHLYGNLVVSATADGPSSANQIGGSGSIVFRGTATQTYTVASGGATAGIIVDKEGGSVTPASGTTALTAERLILRNGSFTAPTGTLTIQDYSPNGDSPQPVIQRTNGTFVHNGGTIYVDPDYAGCGFSLPLSVGAGFTVNHLRIEGGDSCGDNRITYSAPGGDSFLVEGNFAILNENLNGAFYLKGNATVGANVDGGTAAFIFVGTGTQLIHNYAGTAPSGTWRVSKPSGTLALSGSALSLNTSGQDLTLTGGTLDLRGKNLTVNDTLAAQSGTVLRAYGSETITAGTLDLQAGSTVYFSGDGDGAADTYILNGIASTYSHLVVGGTDGMDIFRTNSAITVNKNLTVSGGVLHLNGNTLTLASTSNVSNTSIIRLRGSETLTNFTNDADSGTLQYVGTGSYASLAAGNTYRHVVFNGAGGSWTLGAALDVNGNLTLSGGTLDTSSGNNYAITLSGAWLKRAGATFTPRSGTVTLDGGSQSMSGSTTFYRLTKSVSSAQTLTFAAGTTQTVTNTLTLEGTAGNLLSLRSTQTGNQWKIDPQATRTIGYVDVKDSNNVNASAINCNNNCVNSGNNTNWTFPWQGTVYTDEGSTNIGANKTVAVVINGGLATAGLTDADGFYSIATGSVSPGDVVTIYLAEASDRAVVVSLVDGVAFTGFDLYQNRLIVRSESGSAALTNAHLAIADDNGAPGITDFYTITGNDITVATGKELLVWTGDTYAPGGLVAADDIDINGTFAPAANAVNVSGSWDATGGAFTGTGAVTFDSALPETLTSNASRFQNITFSGVGRVQLQDALNASGALTLSAGALDVNGKTLRNRGGTFANNATLRLRGDETFTGFTNDTDSGVTYFASSGSYANLAGLSSFYNLSFSGAGTWTLANAITAGGTLTLSGGTLDISSSLYGVTAAGWQDTTSGTFVERAGTVTFTGTGTIAANEPFYNVTVNGSGKRATLGRTLDINGALRLQSGTLSASASNHTLTVSGSWISAGGTFAAASGTVILDGRHQTMTGSTTFYNLTKTGALAATLTFQTGSTQIIKGTMTLKGSASQNLSLRSSGAGTQWKVDPRGTRTLQYIDVQDSNNINASAVLCSNDCVNSGNNTNWAFPMTVTVYSNSGTTLIGAGKTVAVAVNGGTKTTADTDSLSVATFTTIGITPGDILTIWLDDETEDAATVTITNTTTLGFDLYRDYLIIRNEQGASVTNSTLQTADNVDDSDLNAIFVMSGSHLVMQSGKKLLIRNGSTFAPGGKVTVDDIFIEGTFTMGSNNVTVAGSWDASDGSFTGSNTVTFTSTGSSVITSNGSTFNNVTFQVEDDSSALWTTTDALAVSGTQTVQSETGVSDTTAPVISSATGSLVTSTKAVITWETDESANSKVVYGTTSGSLTSSATNSNLNLSHSIILQSLTGSTTYYFRVVSADAAGNTATGTQLSFLTSAATASSSSSAAGDSSDSGDSASSAAATTTTGGGGGGSRSRDICSLTKSLGTLALEDVSIEPQEGGTAVVRWTTNDESVSLVQFGIDDVAQRKEFQFDEFTKQHEVTLPRLRSLTQYRVQAISIDKCGGVVTSDEMTFQSDISPYLNDEFAVSGSGSAIDASTLRSIIERYSQVLRSAATALTLDEFKAGLELDAALLAELAALVPGPVLAGEPLVTVTDTTATITWTTNEEATSVVSYAPESAFADGVYLQTVGDPDLRTSEHRVLITNLAPGTRYHYQVRNRTSIGAETRSRDFTFLTSQETIAIVNYQSEILTPQAARFTWNTNFPTTAAVTITPYRGGVLSSTSARTVQVTDMSLAHEITITDFESGVPYAVELWGKADSGLIVSRTIDEFFTSDQDLSPVVSNVQTDAAISPGKESRIQAVVSWTTSEEATGRVYYQKGVASDPEKPLAESTPPDDNFTRRHLVLLPNLEPGVIYSFQVESADGGGHVTRSSTFTILTPRQEEGIFQIILKQMEDVFGWVGNLRAP